MKNCVLLHVIYTKKCSDNAGENTHQLSKFSIGKGVGTGHVGNRN